MRTESNKTNEIWARHVAGEPISALEEEQLVSVLDADEATRKRLLGDDAMHRMLTAIVPMKDDREHFTRGVLARCIEVDQVDAPNDALEAPPIVVDPIPRNTLVTNAVPDNIELLLVRQPKQNTSRRDRPGKSLRRTWKWVKIAAAFTLIFGAGVIAGRTSYGPPKVTIATAPVTSQPVTSQSKKTVRQSAEQNEKTYSPKEFATLTSSTLGGWKNPRIDGSRLTAGKIQLERGEGEIALDNGTTLKLFAPAEVQLVSDKLVSVKKGKISADVPETARGLRVITPTSKVIDQGSNFELIVNPQGATDVVVHQGKVIVEPWPEKNGQCQPLILASSEMNRGKVFESIAQGKINSPLATSVRSDGDVFLGQISVNGKSIEFSSPESFENVRQRVNDRFRESAAQFQQDWAKVIKRFSGGAVGGSLSVNGLSMGFNSVDDIMNLQQDMLQKSRQMGTPKAHGASSFHGTININGKLRNFSSAEEFDRAQREMFGPLKTLGIDVFDMPGLHRIFNAPQQAPDAEAPNNPVVPDDDKNPAIPTSLPTDRMLAL